jgi:hypothetical protein
MTTDTPAPTAWVITDAQHSSLESLADAITHNVTGLRAYADALEANGEQLRLALRNAAPAPQFGSEPFGAGVFGA